MAEAGSHIARRTWSMLRVVLRWARKSSSFKRRLAVELQLGMHKFVKTIGAANPMAARDFRISYARERELSFDETPTFHVKMNHAWSPSVKVRLTRILLPCIEVPQVDYDHDFGNDNDEDYRSEDDGKWFIQSEGGEECGGGGGGGGGGIDSRAEEFIAKFYEEMKLQRQISYLQYGEMLERSAS